MSNSSVPNTELTPMAAPTVPPDSIWGTFFVPGARFCEGRYDYMTIPVGNVRVEPLNVATAGVLALVGIYGVARPSHRVGLIIIFLFGMLFTNGVSSMAAHATVYQGLGFMDSMSEVVMVMIGAATIVDEMTVKKNLFCKRIVRARVRAGISIAAALFIGVFGIFTLAINGANSQTILSVLIGVFTVFLVLSVFAMAQIIAGGCRCCCKERDDAADDEDEMVGLVAREHEVDSILSDLENITRKGDGAIAESVRSVSSKDPVFKDGLRQRLDRLKELFSNDLEAARTKVKRGDEEERQKYAKYDKVSALWLAWRAFVWTAIGFTAWCLDNYLCDRAPLVFRFGHAIWHLALAYAIICLIGFASYLRASNDIKYRPRLRFQNLLCCGWFCCPKGRVPENYWDDDPNYITSGWNFCGMPSVDWVKADEDYEPIPICCCCPPGYDRGT